MPHTEKGCGFVRSNGRFAVLSTSRFDSFNFDDQTWTSLSDISVLDLHRDSLYGASLVVRVSPHIILVVATGEVMMHVENLKHWFILDQPRGNHLLECHGVSNSIAGTYSAWLNASLFSSVLRLHHISSLRSLALYLLSQSLVLSELCDVCYRVKTCKYTHTHTHTRTHAHTHTHTHTD
jgi:hypothetical protein